MYSYFPNNEVNVVFDIEESSNGRWLYHAHRSKDEKYFAPFGWEKVSSTFGIGQINFHVIFFSAQ